MTKKSLLTSARSFDNKLPSHVDPEWLKSFRQRILAWYKRDGRSLPWRETHDPYHVLVSEIMLQQTQANTVIPYFARFLERFPDPASLAKASETEVLSLWEGLGYYRRAKSLHKAAKFIVEQHSGVFPQAFEEILALPGVGRYTAGAIASFAFDQRKPIVEANTQRLYSRLMQWEQDLTSTASQKALWQFAEAILPKNSASTLNHAVMDLGAMICKPKSPTCLICPVKSLCPTFANQLQNNIPAAKRKTKFVDHFEIAVSVFDNAGRLWIWNRPAGGWWAGLWDLPRLSCENFTDENLTKFSRWFEVQFGASCHIAAPLRIFKHSVTHHRIQCHLFTATVNSPDNLEKSNHSTEPEQSNRRTRGTRKNGEEAAWSKMTGGQWAGPAVLETLPFSSSGRKMLEWLLKK